MELSIIIVNYKSEQLIIDCLDSLFSFPPTISLQLIVVNNETGNVVAKELLLERFPDLKWIEMGYNGGFARANNRGIKEATAPVVLLLNGDTLFADNNLQECYRQFINDRYVACGVQLLNPDQSPQISGNYAMKGGLNYLLPLPYLGSLFKFVARGMQVKKPNVPNASSVVEVDWINGAFLMVKMDAIAKAGLLDEDFFLYAEEAEWCSRLRKVGKLCIYGQYKVVHLQGASANKEFDSADKGYMNLYDRKGLQIMTSNLVRIRKEFGVLWFLIIIFFYVIEIPVFSILQTIAALLGRHKYSMKMVRGYTANVVTLMKLAPTIISNKPHFYKT